MFFFLLSFSIQKRRRRSRKGLTFLARFSPYLAFPITWREGRRKGEKVERRTRRRRRRRGMMMMQRESKRMGWDVYTQVKEPRCPDERRRTLTGEGGGGEERDETWTKQVGGGEKKEDSSIFYLLLLLYLRDLRKTRQERRRLFSFFLAWLWFWLCEPSATTYAHRNSMIRIAFLIWYRLAHGHKSPNCCCCCCWCRIFFI